jgi:hypothetical protein
MRFVDSKGILAGVPLFSPRLRLIVSRWSTFLARPVLFPFFLLVLGLLAYGLWLPRLGFYWDDFPLAWIARTYGGEGLARYFATNRPFWGVVYRLTTPILGSDPLSYQVFALFLRLLDAVLLWLLVRRAWPRLEEAARWAGALLVVYPAFSQQYISLVYGHMQLVLAAFLASQLVMLRAVRGGRIALPCFGFAWLLSALNLLCMEYFFLLDLARPVLLWVGLSSAPVFQALSVPRRLARILVLYLPFFLLLVAVTLWRSYGLGFQTYQPTFTTELRAAPGQALLHLISRAFSDSWLAGIAAWLRPFEFSTLGELSSRQGTLFWVVAAAGSILALVYLILTRPAGEKPRRRDWVGFFVYALPVFLFAGGPYWLTDLPITTTFPFDRFTLSFMTGAALLAGGLLAFLPLPRPLKIILPALLLGFSAALQYRHSLVYARDWSVQRSFFWQMTWRIPALQPGTVLLSNELPLEHYSDNSLTAPLNWIYAPDNRSSEMSFMFYYPTVRLGRGLPELTPGLVVKQDYLASHFTGSTSQVVVLYFQPPGCLRVMDPEVEGDIWVVPQSLRDTLKLASSEPILPAGDTRPPAILYGAEPTRNWCYYFAKGDLARQQGDWAAAAALGDQAFALGDYPNDPVERFPFIEAYAYTANWTRALELTQDTRDIAPLYARLACKLWARIERDVPTTPQKDAALAEAYNILDCPP